MILAMESAVPFYKHLTSGGYLFIARDIRRLIFAERALPAAQSLAVVMAGLPIYRRYQISGR